MRTKFHRITAGQTPVADSKLNDSPWKTFSLSLSLSLLFHKGVDPGVFESQPIVRYIKSEREKEQERKTQAWKISSRLDILGYALYICFWRVLRVNREREREEERERDPYMFSRFSDDVRWCCCVTRSRARLWSMSSRGGSPMSTLTPACAHAVFPPNKKKLMTLQRTRIIPRTFDGGWK